MKRENWIYLLAFLCGVILVNLLGSTTWANHSTLNRYSLASLSFRGIEYEEYFMQILLLRFRTVVGLWLLSKVLTKRIVAVGFAVITSLMLGAIAAMAIMANGVWGVLFYLCVLMPHVIFYGLAFVFWYNKKEKFTPLLIFMLTCVGCICEAYVSPIFIENVIKF